MRIKITKRVISKEEFEKIKQDTKDRLSRRCLDSDHKLSEPEYDEDGPLVLIKK